MENQITKKPWNKSSFYGLGSLVAAYIMPYAIIEASFFITMLIDRRQFLDWNAAGRIGPFPIDISGTPDIGFIIAPVAFGLLGLALYFGKRAITATRSGKERGWNLALLVTALSGLSVLFFVLVAIEWFRTG